MPIPKTKKDILLMDVKELAEFLKAEGFEKCPEVFINNKVTGARFLSYKEVELKFLNAEIKQELNRLWKFRETFEKPPDVFRNRKNNQSFKKTKFFFENNNPPSNKRENHLTKPGTSSLSNSNFTITKKKLETLKPVMTKNEEQSNLSFLENEKKNSEIISSNTVEAQSVKEILSQSIFENNSKCITHQNPTAKEKDDAKGTSKQVNRPVIPQKPSQKVLVVSKNNQKPETNALPTFENDLKSEGSEIKVLHEVKNREAYEAAPVVPSLSQMYSTVPKTNDLILADSEVQDIKENKIEKERSTCKNEEVTLLNPSFMECRRKISAHLEDRLSVVVPNVDEVEMEKKYEEGNRDVDDDLPPNLPPKGKTLIQNNSAKITSDDASCNVNIKNDSTINIDQETLEERALKITNKITASKSTEQELYIEGYETAEAQEVYGSQKSNSSMQEGYTRAPPGLKPRKDPAIPTREEQVQIEPEPDLSDLSKEYLDKIINGEKEELFEVPEPSKTNDTEEIKKISQQYEKIIDHPAFIGVSKQKAAQILCKAPKGSYILCAGGENSYALMVKTNKNIHDIPIVVIAERFQIQFEIDKKKDLLMSFAFFDTLIEYYKTNLITMGGEEFYLKKKNRITL